MLPSMSVPALPLPEGGVVGSELLTYRSEGNGRSGRLAGRRRHEKRIQAMRCKQSQPGRCCSELVAPFLCQLVSLIPT
ncbi:hypothetical protein LEMLEM_LOCUS16038 [Lemmus lemmus]